MTVDMSKQITDRQQQGQLIARTNITAGFVTVCFMKG
jgi:hypothetical protein